MSKSKLINFIIALGALSLVPFLAQAKTFAWQDQTWELTEAPINYTEHINVRNDFDIYQIARNQMLGQISTETTPLLSEATLTKITGIATAVNQSAIEPQLEIKNNRASLFEPGQNGQSVDLFKLRLQLLSNLAQASLPVITSTVQTSLAETNSLGINELVAVGESDFSGSPRNRIHNVTVGADKFNGLIIARGEEFSFNRYLGDVDAEHGFLPELVIKPEGTIPEFGGGLCQVSSTTFRAAMNAGLPITDRRNHSYAVAYYAPQGTDATIYPGSADLKFVNNLSSSILMRTRIVGRKLYFEFYGTKDTRTVSFEGPVQYDKKPDGSMKATWTRHVTQDGQTTTQVFNSKYLSPALFHHNAVEQTSTPNPQSPPPPAPDPATPTSPTT